MSFTTIEQSEVNTGQPLKQSLFQKIKDNLDYLHSISNANTVLNVGSSTDNAIPRFDGVTGKVIQNSGIIVDDSNNITGINNLTANNQLQLSTKTTEKSHALSFSGASAGNVCVRTLAITSFEQGTLELEIYGTFSYGNYAGKIIIKAFKQYNLLTIQEMVSYGLLSSVCHISGITCGNADGTCTLLIAYNSTVQAILWGIHYKTTATAITSSTLSNETIGSSSAHWNANIVPSANVDNAMSALTETGFVYDMPVRVLAPASRTAIYATANGNGYSAVYGSNSGTNGYGVYGTASSAGGNGGYFTNTYDGGDSNDSYAIYARALKSPAIYASSRDHYGIYATSTNSYAGYFVGTVYVSSSISADSFIDRTPYPKNKQTAIDAINSLKPLGESVYSENNKKQQLNHEKLHPYLKGSKNGTRDVGATLSCAVRVIQDLLERVAVLETRVGVILIKKEEK